LGRPGVDASVAVAPRGVVLRPAGAGAAGVDQLAVGLIPVRRPLPDVPDRIVEAVAVGGEGPHGGGAGVLVPDEVLPGELALPGVGQVAAAGSALAPPGVGRAV